MRMQTKIIFISLFNKQTEKILINIKDDFKKILKNGKIGMKKKNLKLNYNTRKNK